MAKRIDLKGMSFGKLTVIRLSGEKKARHLAWECQCECGEKTNVLAKNLNSGQTKSCGCLRGLSLAADYDLISGVNRYDYQE